MHLLCTHMTLEREVTLPTTSLPFAKYKKGPVFCKYLTKNEKVKLKNRLHIAEYVQINTRANKQRSGPQYKWITFQMIAVERVLRKI